MREFARRESEPEEGPRESHIADASHARPTSLRRFFHGWLREVEPVVEKRHDDEDVGIRRIPKAESGVITRLTLRTSRQPDLPKAGRAILTIRDLLGLARATVRESDTHRTWPPDVVLKFQAAKVVTRTRRP